MLPERDRKEWKVMLYCKSRQMLMDDGSFDTRDKRSSISTRVSSRSRDEENLGCSDA